MTDDVQSDFHIQWLGVQEEQSEHNKAAARAAEESQQRFLRRTAELREASKNGKTLEYAAKLREEYRQQLREISDEFGRRRAELLGDVEGGEGDSVASPGGTD